MSESEIRSERVLELAEEFLDRYRKGERPPLKEYIDRHPELAAEIKEVFPAMAMMENIAVADSSLEGSEEEAKSRKPKETAPKQLGDYRIIREIGHGGMGIVYEAEQISLGRHVALKVLPNQALADAKHKRRFEREARAAAKLHHTNIVPVFGVGEHEGLPYYVMQFIQGLGLDVVLDELNRMQPGSANTLTGLPTAGEIRVSRRDAADMARSLMTGAFQQQTIDSDGEGLVPLRDAPPPRDAKPRPAVAATVDEPAASRPTPPSASSSSSRSSSHSSSHSGSLSDSFTVSSSSIILPGSSSGSKSGGKRKQSYWQSVANIGRQVAEALEYAHKQGIYHRDIKPSNLLLDLRGTVWVTDFGLAKVAGPGGDNLTHTGDILGTLRYMPPEAFEGKSDARSDVYSLGMTLYELIAMRPAYDEKDRNKLIKKVTTSEPTPLHKVNRDVPRDLVTVIHKSIDREPSRRYATAEAFASDLQRFLDDEPIFARRQTQIERYWRWARHNPGMAILGGVLTAVLLIATFASLIVARHMAQSAKDERIARQDADDAKDREAKERADAEQAKVVAEQAKVVAEQAKVVAERAEKEAEENRGRAEDALKKAEEHFTKARSAVNDYFTAVSEDERLKAPGLQALRVQLLQSALQFYQQFLKERGHDPTLRRELAGVYFKVGEIYRDLGQPAAANRSLLEARRLYETLVKESPNDVDVKYGFAMALGRTGGTLQAVSIMETLIKPDDPKYHGELGELYNTLSLSGTNDRQVNSKQLEYFYKALAVRERLVRLRPDDPDAHMGLSASLNNIAIQLKEDRAAEALALLQRALEEDEISYRLRPNHLLGIRFIGTQLNNVATWAKKLGETDVVVASHRRRVEIFDRRARDFPTIPGFDAELVSAYQRYVLELQQAGRLDDATREADKGLVRIGEMTEETPSFFSTLVGFRLVVHDIALNRAKADPSIKSTSEAAAAVNSMRHLVLSGWRNANFLQTNTSAKALGNRADFKELLAQMNDLASAEATAKLANAISEDKLAARRKILAVLGAVAGPPPHGRFVRRCLLQAKQEWAKALLEAGKIEEARFAFDDALLARQQLVLEFPSNEQLRADLAESQSTAGDLYAAAGKFADAEKIWAKSLGTLRDGLKTNPNSIPFQSALADRLLHIAWHEGVNGMWDRSAEHYRQGSAIQPPTNPTIWNFMAMVGAGTGDWTMQRAAADLAARGTDMTGDNGLFRVRALTISPDLAPAHIEPLQKLADGYRNNPWHNIKWVRALAYLRLGQTDKAHQIVAGLTPKDVDWPEWQIAALIQHRLGNAAAAADALRHAMDLEVNRQKAFLAGDSLKWSPIWDSYLHSHQLLIEAHQTILGKPLPPNPYEKLLRGRVFSALEENDKAEAEFAAAVEMKPDDADVWLARSRLFAKLGDNDRMASDLARYQQLTGNDPKAWVEAGRMLAERGKHQQADAAFARAFELGKGELDRFLESGWWVVGPYPDQLHRPGPPEVNPDPSRPVAALGGKGTLNWQSVPIDLNNGSILTERLPGGSQKNGTYYLLTYVHADRDRTATLNFRCGGDARIWVNGRIALDSMLDWKFNPGDDIQIPVSLKTGRNTLLIKSRHTQKTHNWCECQFTDGPFRLASTLYHAELCADAADAFAQAALRGPLNTYQHRLWVISLLVAGRDAEARRVFADLSKGVDGGGHEAAVVDFLPPAKTEERDQRLANTLKFAADALAANAPNELWRYHRLANAQLRAGNFAEAETSVRKVLTGNQPYCKVLLAIILHYRGKTDEAKKLFAETEEQFANIIKGDLAANRYRSSIWYEEANLYLAQRREARALILGQDSGPSADEMALVARGVARKAHLDKMDDAFARAVEEQPENARLWVARGRRFGELDRWDDAQKAFEKAAQLAPKNVQVWLDRGRAFADLGKTDAAAADFVKALELSTGENVHERIIRLDDVFPLVAKLRPDDRHLRFDRASYLGRSGRWTEVTQALRELTTSDPTEHYNWHTLAPARIQVGELDEYRADCQKMWGIFGTSKDGVIVQRTAKNCLLAPGGLEDLAAVVEALRQSKVPANVVPWRSVTLALGYYRTGQPDRAIGELVNIQKSDEYLQVMALTVRAMAQFKVDQVEAARQSLAEARRAFAHYSIPGPSEPETNWCNWLQSDLLLREASALIPAVVAQAQQPELSAQQQIALRERKARAESVTTQAALAQIRLDLGQRGKAETELRQILAERKKIAGEEPGNIDYLADLAIAHDQLGRLLTSAGRPAEGAKESHEAVALLEKLATENPKLARLQVTLAASLFKIGEADWNAGRLAEGAKAWHQALARLRVVAGAVEKDKNLAKLATELELVAARSYTDLGLWTEATDHYRRAFAADASIGTVQDRLQHAFLLAMAGDEAEYRRFCVRFRESFENASSDRWLARTLVLGPAALADANAVVAVAEAARDATNNEPWAVHDVALAQLRAGRDDAASESLRAFEEVSKREWQFAWPLFALARHKAGSTDEAREWLRKSNEWYGQQWSTHLGNDGASITKGNLFFWGLFLSLRAEATKALTGKTADDPWFHLQRGRVYAKLGLAEKSDAEFQAAVQINPSDLRVFAARGRIYNALGKAAESNADDAMALKIIEEALAKNPDDAAAADLFAQRVLAKPTAQWTSLKPLKIQSENETTLTILPDNSLLASGENPNQETHTIEFEAQGPIVALRLDVLADPRFSGSGPGRSPNGNFLLTDVRVKVGDRDVPWLRAFADFEQRADSRDWVAYPAANAIDDNPSSGWAIHPKSGQSHWVVLVPRETIGGAEKTRLSVRLACEHKDFGQHTLGRFRISTANDPAILRQDAFFSAATTPRSQVAAAYLSRNDPRQARDYLLKTIDINPDATASDWLVLALAHLRLNEADLARKACGKAAEKLRSAGATGDSRKLVLAVVDELGKGDAVAKELNAVSVEPVPAALNDAIKSNPNDAEGYRNRAHWNLERGRMKEAIADLADLHRITSDSLDALRLGVLLHYAGEQAAYRDHCLAMLKRYRGTNSDFDADRTLKLILLTADALGEEKELARFAGVALSGGESNGARGWFLFAKGMHDYRTGEFADAIEASQASRKRFSDAGPMPPLNRILEIMAEYQSGASEPKVAAQKLSAIKGILDRNIPGADTLDFDWMYAHILYQEAERLVANKKAKE